jgi:hypothetical protein
LPMSMVDPFVCPSWLKPDLNEARVAWDLRSSFEKCQRWQQLKLRSNLPPLFQKGNYLRMALTSLEILREMG